ncbi:Oligopeptide-binding protein AliB [Nocardioides sp. PD653]|nr:Oligopeptide-binding protein AliB [Nocardioides sp. PD653-B2]GAW55882.1 Oligopeptide-binding protein AliB [Nocardioides sp. PD653]
MRRAALVTTTALPPGRARLLSLVTASLLMASLGSCSGGSVVDRPGSGESWDAID